MLSRPFSLSALVAIALAFLAFLPRTSRGSQRDPQGPPEVIAPALGAEPLVVHRDPAQNPRFLQLMRHGKLTESVRSRTYGHLQADPLIVEAAWIVSRGLEGAAQGVFVTSLARTPEDQRRLMRRRDTRWWATERSKHLMGGLAADIGFVGRKRSMRWLRDRAEQLLQQGLGAKVAKQIRVVKEAHCLHLELSSATARERIQARKDALINLGIVRRSSQTLVPSLRDYISEHSYRDRVRGALKMAAR